jgi:hypothetical protein
MNGASTQQPENEIIRKSSLFLRISPTPSCIHLGNNVLVLCEAQTKNRKDATPIWVQEDPNNKFITNKTKRHVINARRYIQVGTHSSQPVYAPEKPFKDFRKTKK